MPNDRLRVAFWNVENLFEPGTHHPGPAGMPGGRGPQTQNELDSKISQLANCINAFFSDSGPDLLGLAEVHTERILQGLKDKLNGEYHMIWEPAGGSGETGLAVLGRWPAVSELTKVDIYRPSVLARPRSMIVRCRFAAVTEPVLFVVNHWKSRMVKGVGPFAPNRDREQTANWLGDWLSRSSDETCVIVVGDFNADPFETPFNEFRLRSARHFSTVARSGSTPAYLYNTAWKFLTEPLTWGKDLPGNVGMREYRPKRTHVSGNYVWDQLMVSGRAMKNGPIMLREESVDYHRDGRNSRYNRNGVLVPIRWDYKSHGSFMGASDHYPLVAEFQIL
jgi:endonuclease/exonuclease/phosphatase family metal-dependent hydrolase